MLPKQFRCCNQQPGERKTCNHIWMEKKYDVVKCYAPYEFYRAPCPECGAYAEVHPS